MVASLPSIQALRLHVGSLDGELVKTRAYHAGTGVGGGLFEWDLASTSPDNGGTCIRPDNIATGAWVREWKNITICDFGAYEGQPVAESTACINAAIYAANGRKVIIPVGRFNYSGDVTFPIINISGEKEPNVSSDRGRLLNGSILVGNIKASCKEGFFENFGVDHGSDSFSGDPSDAFVCKASPYQSGEILKVFNIVGLGVSPDDLCHSIAIVGYKNVIASGITGCRTYYGAAIKATSSFIQNLKAIENGYCGLIVKADTIYGFASDVCISGVVVEGMGECGVGLNIESYDKQIQRIDVSGLVVNDCDSALRLRGDIMASQVNVRGIIGKNLAGDAIRQEGTAYAVNISDVNLSSVGARAVRLDKTVHANIHSVTASATSANPNFATDFIQVGSQCKNINLDGINLVKEYSSSSKGKILVEPGATVKLGSGNYV